MQNESEFADHLRTTIATVYFIGARRGLVKIGRANDVRKRLWQLQPGCPDRLELLAAVDAHPLLESRYHDMFADSRQRGEWFKQTPAMTTEMQRLNRLAIARGEQRRRALQEHRDLLIAWGVPNDIIPCPVETRVRMLMPAKRLAENIARLNGEAAHG